ncbi:hypothetical protein OG426_45935 [Streptomyces canus]|uniref:hypothetical protein n=1 Tax=Streptomyces canus TaxID=58343 RepID=UPI002254FE7B|nr:hypothetical protein [Streptomyces canus]MCX4855366.1 hypothetical protein [Streptomyces canus]WSW39254.1 hypothetical protein OG426_45935 [Streptomyces canus]
MEPDEEAGGGTVAVPGNALKTWEKVRGFALGLPGAAEAHAHALTFPGAAPKRLIAELDAR